MNTHDLLQQYEELDDGFVARREVCERIPQRAYSPRHERRRAKAENLRTGSHRRRVKR